MAGNIDFFQKFKHEFNIHNLDFFIFLSDLCENFHINPDLISSFFQFDNRLIQNSQNDCFFKTVKTICIEQINYFEKEMEIFGKQTQNGWVTSLDPTDQTRLYKFIKDNPQYTIRNGNVTL